MILWFFRQLLYCRQAVAGDLSPSRLALGCGLGMVLGLVPKGNLVAVLLAMLIFALQLNLGAAMLTTLGCSLLSPFLDPFTGAIGSSLLGNPALSGYWLAFFELPLAPWTGCNNSVVLGSLVLGSAALLPTYFGSRFCFRRWLRMLEKEDEVSEPTISAGGV